MSFDSTHQSYGQLDCKQLQFAQRLISNGSNDDDYQLTIECANQSADRTLSIGVLGANQNLLHDGSTLDASKVNVNGATAVASLQDTDMFLVHDDSAGANRKVTFANLKSGIEHTHSGSSGQVEISDGSSFAAKTLSGDMTIDSNGVCTDSNKPGMSGVAMGNKQVVVDITKSVTGLGSVSCTSMTTSGNVQCASMRIGTSKWELAVNASNNKLELRYWTGASYVVKLTFDSS